MSIGSKVALVTAGSAGLGAAVARPFAREANMRVVVNYYSNSERAEKLIQELRRGAIPTKEHTISNEPRRFVAIKADMQDRSAVKRLVQDTLVTMGRLDIVVSNAGWTRMRNFADLCDNVHEDDWERCFTANVKSHLWLFHAAHAYLAESRGAFVSTASVAGVKPSGSSIVSVRMALKC